MPRSKPHGHLYAHKILTAVVDFLCAAGTSEAEIREIVERRLTAVATDSSQKRGAASGRSDDTVSAAVLHRWHRDSELLDTDASPRPLKLFGPAPSVEAVVRSERPRSSAKGIIADMLALGLLRKTRDAEYLPKARVATIGTLHPVLIEHVAKSLVRLLETVQSNTSSKPTASPLIERFTHIPDLPLSRASDFRKFSQEHGSAFLASVDDWLEARRVRNSSKKTTGVAAGVHVYAYIEKPPAKKPRPRSRAKRA
jgi:hypothetical protein